MRLGINSPIVTQFPGAHAQWEADAGIGDLARIAATADRLGFDHLTCSEHVAVPVTVADERGGTYWDPLATFGFLAARTERIRMATQVLVLGYHHPLEIAKRYGTLDAISGGRLVLGVGVGSLEQEFELLGASFGDRGARADDALRALRVALSSERPEYHGPHYDFADVVVRPAASAPRVPIWVGGRTVRSLRRAMELADGWVPFGLGRRRLCEMLGEVDLPDGFDVVLAAGTIDPTADPEATRDAVGRTAEAGATIVDVTISASSADHYLDQLAATAELFGTR
ncbi:TIGR03619 family F420-dependent LLM class oxidoreductase [Gordonia sp. SID5947]|uniref:LLM class F420-dependent oxidoreductase n=1 Tax=Gordonia sp. SID5947 TaxID=2690315 RepID=UPI00136FC0E9|nr:LLM class F420-dependent oxidoreductase [Gordonia sp. SID5947]MYR07298.1 TIGR03619 family F420-dependent LLM class oxidoreductase [Gordonia sp. SID5947]